MSGACSGAIPAGFRSGRGCGRGGAARVGRGQIGDGPGRVAGPEGGGAGVTFRAEPAFPAGPLPGAPGSGPGRGGGGSA